MSKKSSARKNGKKVVNPTVSAVADITATAEVELSYEEMLSELEVIISEAGVRLTEEEFSL